MVMDGTDGTVHITVGDTHTAAIGVMAMEVTTGTDITMDTGMGTTQVPATTTITARIIMVIHIIMDREIISDQQIHKVEPITWAV